MASSNERIDEIFWGALQLPSDQERAAYLADACGADVEVRKLVEKLLRAQPKVGEFLEQPFTRPAVTVDHHCTEAAGAVIGPYRLLQSIGEGGMGMVWMAEQTAPVQRKVALKIIKPGMDTRQVLARFEAERQALALMDHPNIAKVLDAGSTDAGRPYFVMELVKGQPITRYCDEHRLTPRQRLELFVPVCQAIQHAHQKGLIHRDIKPSNVLVAPYDGKPVVKVIDFGVAKAAGQRLTDKTLFTEFGAVVGTLEYMSPEQAELNNQDIDTRSDIYSLGVLLYELLTGTTPLDRKRLKEVAFMEVLRAIREEEPPRPSTRLSASKDSLPSISAQRQMEPAKLTRLVRGELDWIVMKALDKDRSRRYETANGFALDLERYLHDEPVAAGPPSARYRLRKFIRRNRGFVVAAALVLLALITGTIGTTWGMIAANQARSAEALRAESEARAKIEAEEQAAIAIAVNDFLQNDLLGQADVAKQGKGKKKKGPPKGDGPPAGPGVARDPNVKVRTLLDRAAWSIEDRFAEAPLIEAAIRMTIGHSYMSLAEYAEAERHLVRAVAIRTAKRGPDHAETLDSKIALGILYVHKGNLPRAESLFEDVAAKRLAQFGPDHVSTIKARQQLAQIYTLLSKLGPAEAVYRQIIGSPQADPHMVMHSKRFLASILFRQGKVAAAETVLVELVSTCVLRLGEDHPETLVGQMELAKVWGRQGQVERAEKFLNEILQKTEAVRGPDHPNTVQVKMELGKLFLEHGQPDRAKAYFDEALEVNDEKLGPLHGKTLDAKLMIARVHLDKAEYDRAEPLLLEIIKSEAAERDPALAPVLRAKMGLGMLYSRSGKPDRAEPYLLEVLKFQSARGEPDHPETLKAKHALAMVYRDQGKYEQSESLLRECLAILEKTHAGQWQSFHTKACLGGALLMQKKYAEAESHLLQGYEGLKKLQSEAPLPAQSDLPVIAQLIVQLYEDRGPPAQAKRWRQELEGYRGAQNHGTKPK